MTKKFAIILTALVLLISVRSAYCAKKNQDSKIILEHADVMRSVGDVRHLIGNVHISHGEKIITADRARYDANAGVIELNNNVEIFEPDQKMLAQKITYFENTGNYEAIGKTDFTQLDSVRIRCNVAKYYESDEILDLNINVIINNFSDGAAITGKRGKWFNDKKTAIITGDPEYKLPYSNENDQDTLVINSKQITFFNEYNSAIFSGDVELKLGELLAISDSLNHMPDSALTVLSGTPTIWRETDRLSGDSILLYFEEKELNRIVVEGEGVIRSEAMLGKDVYNNLSGDKLIISIINDSTRFVRAQGNARGEYHIWDESEVYQGENISTANMIDILLEGNKAQNINLLGSTSGTFYPPRFVPKSQVGSGTEGNTTE